MTTALNAAQANLLREQCLAVFCMYEHQSNAGINWGNVLGMPESLARALPVRCIRVQHGGCLKLLRVFCPERAAALLKLIQFEDFLLYMSRHGYEECREEFVKRLTLYIQSEQAKLISLF